MLIRKVEEKYSSAQDRFYFWLKILVFLGYFLIYSCGCVELCSENLVDTLSTFIRFRNIFLVSLLKYVFSKTDRMFESRFNNIHFWFHFTMCEVLSICWVFSIFFETNVNKFWAFPSNQRSHYHSNKKHFHFLRARAVVAAGGHGGRALRPNGSLHERHQVADICFWRMRQLWRDV